VALGHLAEIHFPKEMTCGFEAAAHSIRVAKSTTRISKSFPSMIEDWHERRNRCKDG